MPVQTNVKKKPSTVASADKKVVPVVKDPSASMTQPSATTAPELLPTPNKEKVKVEEPAEKPVKKTQNHFHFAVYSSQLQFSRQFFAVPRDFDARRRT